MTPSSRPDLQAEDAVGRDGSGEKHCRLTATIACGLASLGERSRFGAGTTTIIGATTITEYRRATGAGRKTCTKREPLVLRLARFESATGGWVRRWFCVSGNCAANNIQSNKQGGKPHGPPPTRGGPETRTANRLAGRSVFARVATPVVEDRKRVFHHAFPPNSPASLNQRQVLKWAAMFADFHRESAANQS